MGHQMNIQQAEQKIRAEVSSRQYNLQPSADWYTPSGKQRSFPMYEMTIHNTYLRNTRTIKGKTAHEVQFKAQQQIQKWHDEEIRKRVADAKRAQQKEKEAAVPIDL